MINPRSLSYSIFILAILLVILIGCAGTALLEPYNPRIPIFVAPLTTQDLNYALLDPPFEVLASAALTPDFYDLHEPDFNNFHIMRSYQNPFRPISFVSHETPMFTLKGEVERIAYEPVSEVKKYITAYALWGLIGLAAEKSDGTMAAYVQYRFQVIDNANAVIDTLLVIGAASGHPQRISRKELIETANYFAAGDLSSQLLKHRKLRIGVNVQSRSIEYYSLELKANRWLSFMKGKLKDVK